MEFRKHFVIAISRKFKALPIFGFLSLLIFGFLFFSGSVFEPYLGKQVSKARYAPASATPADATVKQKAQATLMRLPLSFEANEGQTDAQVKFLSRSGNHSVFFTPDKIVMGLSSAKVDPSPVGGGIVSVRKTAFAPSPIIPAPSGPPFIKGGSRRQGDFWVCAESLARASKN